ncbi:hypothetical protein LSAT2_009488, partial [Lamellibrachia satsuma]
MSCRSVVWLGPCAGHSPRSTGRLVTGDTPHDSTDTANRSSLEFFGQRLLSARLQRASRSVIFRGIDAAAVFALVLRVAVVDSAGRRPQIADKSLRARTIAHITRQQKYHQGASQTACCPVDAAAAKGLDSSGEPTYVSSFIPPTWTLTRARRPLQQLWQTAFPSIQRRR